MIKFIFLIILLTFSNVSAEVVNKIDIKGNQRISDKTIALFSEVDLGQNLGANDVNNITKNLYETNFFNLVKIDLNDGTLSIIVEESPIIQNINIEGLKNKTVIESINDSLYLKSRSSFNKFFLEKDKQAIKKTLNKIGYFFSNIEVFIEELDDNKININYEIDLGKKSKIKKISFVGDKVFKNKKLKNIIISEEYKFWKFISGSKYLNEDIISYDVNLLKNFYLNRGFFNVQINASFAKLVENNNFELIYNINAGEKIYFNDFVLNLPLDYNENNYDKISKLFINLKNKPYSLYSINKILEQIENITLDEQYESIKASINEEIINDKINIEFTIEEVKRQFVEKINIAGNSVTNENVIRNQILVDEGDPFNEILLSRSINKIKSLNFFKSVENETKNTEDGNSKIININVEEKPTGEITAGAGVGTDGATIGFGVRENNYLGKGIALEASTNFSEDAIRGVFSVTNPNYKNTDKSVNFSVESTEVDKLTSVGFKSLKSGFTLGTSFEYFDDLFLGISSANYYEDIEVNSKASSTKRKMAGDYLDSFVNFNFLYDKRNQKFDTTDGFFSKYSIDIPVLSETSTFKNQYDYKVFTELYENNVSTFSFMVGSAISLNNEDVKLSERLFVPANKLRGFEKNKIGPKDGSDYIGGNYVTTLNFTTTVPQLFEDSQNFDFLLFLDAANVWGIDYDASLKDNSEIRSSVGLGLNWNTVVGPLSFSLAQPITKNSNDKTETFRFNIGTTF